MDSQILRIVPAPLNSDTKAQRTQGTKVFVGDTPLHGVTRIELVAEVNNVWRARIDCMVSPPADLMAESVTYYPTLWQRFRGWISGLL